MRRRRLINFERHFPRGLLLPVTSKRDGPRKTGKSTRGYVYKATLGAMSLRATVNAKVDWRGRTLRPANEVFCPWAHATAPCSGLSITAASNISNYRMKRIIAEHVAPLLTEITVNACDAMRCVSLKQFAIATSPVARTCSKGRGNEEESDDRR